MLFLSLSGNLVCFPLTLQQRPGAPLPTQDSGPASILPAGPFSVTKRDDFTEPEGEGIENRLNERQGL